MGVSLAIPTKNAGEMWQNCVDAIKEQTLNFDQILVIDSGSTDSTVEIARSAGFEVYQIDPSEFDHGATRQFAVEVLGGSDIVIFMTHDALLDSPDACELLIEVFDKNSSIAAVCGRQLPAHGATSIAKFSRHHNYPSTSYTADMAFAEQVGLQAVMMSNSFAAYRVKSLRSIGGFTKGIIFGEDMHVAMRFLINDFSIAYNAAACVRHSHNYSLWQEGRRYFDIGVFHASESDLFSQFKSAESTGFVYVINEQIFLWRSNKSQMLSALVRAAYKLVMYRLGKVYKSLPPSLIQYVSMNKNFFSR